MGTSTLPHADPARLGQRADDETLVFHVIYFNPVDYPGLHVLRRHYLRRGDRWPDPECVTAPDLATIRAGLPGGLFNMGRFSDDDPAILEVWI